MPTGLQDSGFFSDEAASISAEIKTDYKQLLLYLSEMNIQAHKYLATLQVADQDLKELVTAALLARALTGYQALMLLAERGFASEVRAICRSLLEAKFRLGFLAEEPSAAILMLAKHEEERIKRLKKMKSGDLPVPKDLANQDGDTVIARAEARRKSLAGRTVKLPTIKDMAEKGGFSTDYFGPYAFLSDATHSGVRELEIYLEFDVEQKAATNFRYGPNNGPWIPWCTLIATGYLLDCIEITAIIFDVRKVRRFDSWFKARCKRHKEILDRYRDLLSADFKAGKS